MKENDPNYEMDFWANYVEQALAKDEESVPVPMESMTDGVAVAVATRLKVSLKAKGAYYLFNIAQDPIA